MTFKNKNAAVDTNIVNFVTLFLAVFIHTFHYMCESVELFNTVYSKHVVIFGNYSSYW